MFGGGKMSKFPFRNPLASKTLKNSCLFALLILHIIVSITDIPHVYITHMSVNNVVEPMMHRLSQLQIHQCKSSYDEELTYNQWINVAVGLYC